MPEDKRQDRGVIYEFRICSRLDDQWSDWLGDLQMTYEDDETVLWGEVADQAALYGIIARLRNLGLTLVSVNPRAPEATHESSN